MKTSKKNASVPPQAPPPPPPAVPPKDIHFQQTIVLPTEAAAAAEASKANRQQRNTNEKNNSSSSSSRGLKFWKSSATTNDERVRRPSLPKLINASSNFRSLRRRDTKSSSNVSVPNNNNNNNSKAASPPTPPSEEEHNPPDLMQFFDNNNRVIGMEGSDYATLDQCCRVILEYLQSDNDNVAIALHAVRYLIDQYRWPPHIKLDSTASSKDDVVNLISDMCRHLRGKDNDCSFAPKYVRENPHPLVHLRMQQRENNALLPNYTSMWPDHMDPNTGRFRQHFVGKPYLTFVTPEDAEECAIISAVRECDPENKDVVFHIIVRSSTHGKAEYHMLTEADLYKKCDIQETESQQSAESNATSTVKFSSPPAAPLLRSRRIGSIRRRSPAAADQDSSRALRKAVSIACPDIQVLSLRSLSAEATIMAGMEKELLRFDEMAIPKNYKFGVLVVRGSQKTEEEWYSNTGMSNSLVRFLDLVGTKIELNGYIGYAGGLDTKAGETGEFSYVSRWREHEIMFHVCPLMPLREQDKQQINRKRHVGNDIVCIVFVEQGGEFDPTIVRSQFLHVFVVVRPAVDLPDSWSIQVIRQATVPEFGPHIPATLPSSHLKDFILLKMINAENAALKADKFAQPNMKARTSMLKNIASGVADLSSRKSGERPRSAGRYRERISLDVSPPSPPTIIHPHPTPTRSRSTVLRDFTRRRARLGSNNKNNNNRAATSIDSNIISSSSSSSSSSNSSNSSNSTSASPNAAATVTTTSNDIPPPSNNGSSSFLTPIPSISSALLGGESRLRARAQNLMSNVMNRRS